MKDGVQELPKAFSVALQKYLTAGVDSSSEYAQEIGRNALADAGDFAKFSAAFIRELVSAVTHAAADYERTQIVGRATEFWTATFSAYTDLAASDRNAWNTEPHRKPTSGEKPLSENAPLASDEQMRLLADAMPQIVWSARADGTFDYFNRQWYLYTGISAHHLCEHGWDSVIHPDDCRLNQDRWQTAIRTGEPYQCQCRLYHHTSGAYRWHLCRALPVRSRDGRIIRWYGTCTDIDQQKRTEDALRVADRRKNQFLAVLSHELRNPLAPIRNSLQLLRFGSIREEDVVSAREVIERQVQLMVGIIDDMLDAFHIAHQSMNLEKETLDVGRLVRLLAEDHRPNLESNRRTIEVTIPPTSVWVYGDIRRLGQVITNLLTNAAKYTNPGDRITIEVREDPPNQRVLLSVRDTGIGISSESLPHVFDTFSRAEESMHRRQGGLGLGLSIVRGIVELHGGQVYAQSGGLGRGTVVSFWLPLSQPPTELRRSTTSLTTTMYARNLRILIIEDNQDTARSLEKLLRRYGHEVLSAFTGPEGMQQATNWQPEVVLCDLGLPDLDGYEVARQLRSHPETKGIRLIAISGYGQADDRQRSQEAGFDLHLVKPVDPAELQRLLTVLKIGA